MLRMYLLTSGLFKRKSQERLGLERKKRKRVSHNYTVENIIPFFSHHFVVRQIFDIVSSSFLGMFVVSSCK